MEFALQILDLFSATTPQLTLTDISARLGTDNATAHRLLKTLEDAAVLSRVGETERYRLGSKLLTLGARTLSQFPVLEMGGPYLRLLAHELGETVAFSHYDNGDVVYLDCVDSPHAISVTLHIGGRAPAHCVASGRAILSRLDATELDRLLSAGPRACNGETSVDCQHLLAELELVRKRGFAVDDGDFRTGVRAAAAAVLDAQVRPVGAITAVGLAADLSMERVHALGPQVARVARSLSEALGCPADLRLY